ncbi:MAG TPA: DUF1003 domain-containing protein [Blastocatellia bacterium]|nr:DUF1003 domain-containing protein [Blastocatellia bacterium]
MRDQEHRHKQAADLDPTRSNVDAIVRLEQEALLQRSPAERMSDAITHFTGSVAFVIIHVLLFAFWVAANLSLIPWVRPFDPFPFGILTLIVSAEGVFLAIFILISQNRMTRQADRRAHLDLQISILAEQELTMILQMHQSLCRQLGVEIKDEMGEVTRLAQRTDVQRLENELKDRLP